MIFNKKTYKKMNNFNNNNNINNNNNMKKLINFFKIKLQINLRN